METLTKCRQCGKEFPHRLLRGKPQIFCSRSCAGKNHGSRKREKGGKEVECRVCGTKFYSNPKKAFTGRAKFCSLKCKRADKTFWMNANGPRHHNWRGGTCRVKKYLYRKAEDHPFKNSGGYVAEHRLVMEKEIGRYLTKNEEVHHKNGLKMDNRIENLEIVLKSAHFGVVLCPHCCKEFKIK